MLEHLLREQGGSSSDQLNKPVDAGARWSNFTNWHDKRQALATERLLLHRTLGLACHTVHETTQPYRSKGLAILADHRPYSTSQDGMTS